MAERKYSPEQIYDALYYGVFEDKENLKRSTEELTRGYCNAFLKLSEGGSLQKDLAHELVLRTWGVIAYSDGNIASEELNAFRQWIGEPTYTVADFAKIFAGYKTNTSKERCFELFKKINNNKARTYYVKFCMALSICDRNYNEKEIQFCRRLCRLYDVHE